VGVGRESLFEVLSRLQLERIALLTIVARGDGIEVEPNSCRALLRLAFTMHPYLRTALTIQPYGVSMQHATRTWLSAAVAPSPSMSSKHVRNLTRWSCVVVVAFQPSTAHRNHLGGKAEDSIALLFQLFQRPR
jgi:hypothetical protein